MTSVRWSRPNRLAEPDPDDAQLDLLRDYRADLVTTAKTAGLKRSARADPDGLARVLEAIAELAAEGRWFTSDDVRARTGPGFGAVTGAAFHVARRRGIIDAVGTETSKVQSTHGRLIRTWRGV
jgi:hypothetical protein